MSNNVLPNFRRVPPNTAAEWSGSEEEPAFVKPLRAVAEYRKLSQASKYWWMSAFTLLIVLPPDYFLPARLAMYAHAAMLLVVFVFAVRAAFMAARAHSRARKLDKDATREQKWGVMEEVQEDEQTSRPAIG